MRERRAEARPAKATRPSRRGPRIVICLLLILVTAGIYQQTLRHDFINFDDNGYVFDNKHVQAGLTAATVAYAFTTTDEYNWHPLTWLSHALDCQLYGLKPAGHHLTGMLLHIANTLLLFLVLSRMTGRLWRAGFVAALFAIHPLHVESVAWAAERKDVLSTFFWMSTMLAYLWYVAEPKIGRYLVVVALFAFGLMAKPMLVTLPIVLLLLDYWPLRREDHESTKVRKDESLESPFVFSRFRVFVIEKTPLFALALASSVVTCIVQSGKPMASLEQFPIGVRLGNAAVSCVAYIGKMLWPERLSVFYPHLRRSIPSWQVAGSLLLLVCVSALVIAAGKKRPYLGVGWLWYLVTLAPVIGLVQVGTQAMADRYTYLPLIGVFVMIAWGVPDLLGRARSRTVAALAIAVILVLIPLSYRQVGYWQDTATLFGHTISIFPNDAAAHVLVADAAEHRGDNDQALREYTRAVELNPSLPEARFNLAALLARNGEFDKAIEHYSACARLQPRNARAHCCLGDALYRLKKNEAAIQEYKAAIRIDPNYAEAYYNMGVALLDMQQNEQAADCFSNAVRIRPDYAEAHGNLAIAHYSRGNYAEAWREAHLSRKYDTEPNPDFLAALSQKMPEPPR